MSEDADKPKDDSSSLQNKLSRIFGHGQEKLRSSVKDWDARKALDAVLDAPKSLKRMAKTRCYRYSYKVPNYHGNTLFDGICFLCLPFGVR